MDCINALTNHIIKRTYEEQIYRNLLKDVGYHSVKTFTDFNIHSHEEDAHRLFFVAKNKFLKVKSLLSTLIILKE